MRLRVILIALTAAVPFIAGAQSVNEIKNSADYIYGEGFGETVAEADNDALRSLISKISVSVESDFSQVEEEVVSIEGMNATSKVNSVMQTYSQATLQNTERIITKNAPNAEVFRYVKRSDVNKIFESRKKVLTDWLESAAKAESKGKLDNALRLYYWGYCLLQSLPNSNDMVDAAGKTLVTVIPEHINEILEDIRFYKTNEDGNFVELQVMYNGNPVTSLEFTFFDGMGWSNRVTATDGRSVIEMRPGASHNNIRIACEYKYENQTHVDKNIEPLAGLIRAKNFPKASMTVQADAPMMAMSSNTATTTHAISQTVIAEVDDSPVSAFESAPEYSTLTLLDATQAKPYNDVMDKITAAIKQGKYDSVKDQFTTDGLDMFTKLVNYGKGRIIGTPKLEYMALGKEVVCRSLPIRFSFSNNNRQFVENITFTFNEDKKIDCLAFGLDEKASYDILHHPAWDEYARKILIEFLENYKTAYSLKRWDYLNQVFDDNAVIIVGKVVEKPTTNTEKLNEYTNNRFVTQTRLSKETYMQNLKRCFDSNEFINIRFAENDIYKAGRGGEIYGIQIKQDYYSSNYGDTGYLWLMVDLNDPKQPVIKVRIWNPERDENFHGLASF